MIRYLLIGLILFVGCTNSQNTTEQSSEQTPQKIIEYNTTGPANGSLVIVGGHMQDPAILAKFFELGGGADKNYVVIPTASADTVTEELMSRARSLLIDAGASNVTVLHTKDKAEANSDNFLAPIQAAQGVWFVGGRQWRIVDSYAGTKTLDEFHKVLERGGVIGGTSAGATIQGSYLARGDTKANTIMMGDHEEGFAFVKNIAIDQHLLQRNRQFDLVEIIRAKPELLGIGLDENTAIVVTGNDFEIVGPSYVAIHDHKLWQVNEDQDVFRPFFLLRAGDKFNIKTRKVTWAEDNERENPIF